MPPPRKGRYRVYSESHVDALNLIKEAKLLGVTLSQLKAVIVYKDGNVEWSFVERFLSDIKNKWLLEIDALSGKVQRLEQCMLEIDACPLMVDSPPKGRD